MLCMLVHATQEYICAQAKKKPWIIEIQKRKTKTQQKKNQNLRCLQNVMMLLADRSERSKVVRCTLCMLVHAGARYAGMLLCASKEKTCVESWKYKKEKEKQSKNKIRTCDVFWKWWVCLLISLSDVRWHGARCARCACCACYAGLLSCIVHRRIKKPWIIKKPDKKKIRICDVIWRTSWAHWCK